MTEILNLVSKLSITTLPKIDIFHFLGQKYKAKANTNTWVKTSIRVSVEFPHSTRNYDHINA